MATIKKITKSLHEVTYLLANFHGLLRLLLLILARLEAELLVKVQAAQPGHPHLDLIGLLVSLQLLEDGPGLLRTEVLLAQPADLLLPQTVLQALFRGS